MNYKAEIFVDNFAGGGGASTGIEIAIGRSVDIAINHDPDAIAMHKVNHPKTKHYCEDVWQVDPRKVCAGRPVGLAWFSPDCKHFSRAKGGKPADKNIRGLAWVAVRWAATVHPRVIMLENVPEIVTWGPVGKDGKPIKEKAGCIFRSFVRQLEGHGYKVEWRQLKSCDYGAPTTRNRFYLIARNDGKPIVWPEPTHAPKNSKAVKEGRLKPYRTAAECIDWSIPTQSIFERKKPLAENTLKRIARGIEKYVINNPKPFIVTVNHGGEGFRGQPLDIPLNTVTAKHGYGIVTPYITKFQQNSTGQVMEHPKETEHRGQTVEEPIKTVDTSNRYGVAAAFLAKNYGGGYTGAGIMTLRNHMDGQKIDEPLGTITASGNHHAEVIAFLTKYYSNKDNVQSIDEPLHTVVSKEYVITDIHMRMLQPHELFAAQGFPPGYIIDRDSDGNPYPKSKQVEWCGNAVTPPVPAALVRANLPEHCKKEDEEGG